jgi:hypothetical protein
MILSAAFSSTTPDPPHIPQHRYRTPRGVSIRWNPPLQAGHLTCFIHLQRLERGLLPAPELTV